MNYAEKDNLPIFLDVTAAQRYKQKELFVKNVNLFVHCS